MKVEGSCHCGQITYEAEVDPNAVAVCNCSDCQMLTGTAFRVSARVPRENFRLLSGTLKKYVKTADSGKKRAHSFCPNCGSPIIACDDVKDPPTYSLRIGGLKQRHDLPPKQRIWCRSAIQWAQNISMLPGRDGQ